MQVCYLIVNLNAISYSDRFTEKHQPMIHPGNGLTEEQPWRFLCQLQAYLIFSCWMVRKQLIQTSFLLSVVLMTFEYWVLSNKLYESRRWKRTLFIGCFVGPMLLHLIPWLYPDYGYGPNGFSIPSEDGWLDIYFFSGWRSSLAQHDSSGEWKQQIAYGFNFMLPLFLFLLYELYLLYRIKKVKNIHKEQGIQLAAEHIEITRLHRVPQSLFFILVVNMVIRMLPTIEDQLPSFIRYGILCWDFVFDMIPILSCYQFFNFIKKSIVLERLGFLGRHLDDNRGSFRGMLDNRGSQLLSSPRD